MFKKAIAITAFIITLTAAGCVGNGGETVKEDAKYNLIVNNGWGVFVYTVQDKETGVWYIATEGGVTPRLNKDGSLYTEE